MDAKWETSGSGERRVGEQLRTTLPDLVLELELYHAAAEAAGIIIRSVFNEQVVSMQDACRDKFRSDFAL